MMRSRPLELLRSAARAAVPLVLATACGGGDERVAGAYPPAGEPQSLVVFLVDTLRVDHLGCYGYERDTSPHLDALGREGIVFEHCLAQSTWTKPTSATLHTGLLPSRHGANETAAQVRVEFETLAERLKSAGYRTAGFGYNPNVFGSATGFEQGFDVFEEVLSDRPVPEPTNAAGIGDEFAEGARAEQVVGRALEWLDGVDRDEPFFLYVHLIDVHMPLRPPEPFASRFARVPQPDGLDPWDLVAEPEKLDEEGWTMLKDLYDAEIAYVDAQLERLTSGLAERGLSDDTALVFVSDHGEEFFEHGHYGHSDAQIYSEIVHVPLVLSAPGLPDDWRGARVPSLVQQIDLVPTALDLAGLEPDPTLPGRSLLEPLRAPREALDTIGLVEAQSATKYRKAVVQGDLKYARTWRPAKTEELYDLRADPGERSDLLVDDATRADRHRVILDQHLRDVPGRYRFVIENTGAETRRVVGFLSTVGMTLQTGSVLGCDDGSDGPYAILEHQRDGEPAFAFRFELDLPPGDVDAVVVHPHPFSERLEVLFRVDGADGDPEAVGVGGDGLAPAAIPFELDLTDPGPLFSVEPAFPSASAASEAGYRVSVVRMMDEVAPLGELSDADKAALRALGYTDE